jgi:hypothetical protein
MKSKGVLILLAGLLVLALAGGAAWANDTTYDPTNKTIDQTQPFTENFNITITSPTSVGFSPVNVTTTIEITVTYKPAGVTDAYALALISATPESLTFTATGQSKTVNIAVNVSATTIPGTYAYNILAKKPTGPGYSGWGNGTPIALTVVVNEPTTTPDTTPPSVTINKPTENQSFAFCIGGTPVDVAFNAQDADSLISSVSADVNGNAVTLSTTGLNTNSVDATGIYTAAAIGAYTVNAFATSAGGEGHATVTFSVNYNLMWLPPLSLGKTNQKGGSTVPIKFTARDCNGAFVHDDNVKVVVYEVTGTGDVEALTGYFGEGAASVRIDDVAGQYIINFPTASGIHNYRADVYFNDFLGNPFKQGSKTFSVR